MKIRFLADLLVRAASEADEWANRICALPL